MNEIPRDVLGILLEIGQLADGGTPIPEGMLSALQPYDYINRLHYTEWDAVTCELSENQLVLLIRGLTVAESSLRWIGGSVAACIFVFRELERRRNTALVAETARWVFVHRGNPYLPFGSMKYASYEDYLWQHSEAYHELRRQRRAAQEERQRQEQVLAQSRRTQRKLFAEQHQAIGRSKAGLRHQVLEQLALLPLDERVRALAQDRSVTIDFYPPDWAAIPDEAIVGFSEETRQQLAKRLATAGRGAWRDLRKRLAQLDCGKSEPP